jgi:hypothetical protein
MSREEALAIVVDVLEQHPDFLPDREEMGTEETGEFVTLPRKERARRVLDYLARKDVGWVEDVQLPDWQRRVRFDAHGAILLDAPRRIARSDAAVFTDPFVGVCATLANVDAFAKEPFIHLENCLKGATDGLRELRGMGKSIERFIRRQLEARTLAPSYQHTFHVGDYLRQEVGMLCAKVTRPFRGVTVAENIERVVVGRSRPHKTLDFIWGEGLHWAKVDAQRRAADDGGPKLRRDRCVRRSKCLGPLTNIFQRVGPDLVFGRLWETLRLDAIIKQALQPRHFGFDVERAVWTGIAGV